MSARSLNKVMLIGNLTRDPNLRYTANNTAVCSFGLATNRTWVPSDGGEKQEKVEFHNAVAWGKLAEICGQLLHKGDKAYVDGRLQTRDWKGEDGNERRTTEVIIENMILLNSRSGSGSDDTAGSFSSSDDGAGSAQSQAVKSGKGKKAKADDQDSASDVNSADVEDIADDIPF